jgi:error-prone DNA polymerase
MCTSHQEELGFARFGICDLNGRTGALHGHVAAKVAGLPFRIDCRSNSTTAPSGWPANRAYGRLTAMLLRGRMHAPRSECRISGTATLAAAEGWALAAIPPAEVGAVWAAGLRRLRPPPCERPLHA